MFKKILIPVDFSACSKAALKTALAMAKAFDSELEVIHAYEVPNYIPPHVVVMMGDIQATLSEHAERHAKIQLDELIASEDAAGVKLKRGVLFGPAANVVIEQVEKGDYDLVVMGTHGRTGWSRLVMGSVASKVLRGAPCAVLTVRGPDE